MSSDSSSGSDSSSDSESDSNNFKRNVSFKKKITASVQKNEDDSDRRQEIAVSAINSNLKRMEQLSANTGDSLLNDEKRLCLSVDDTDSPETDATEKELWKQRELKRLHKERNMRIQREQSMIRNE